LYSLTPQLLPIMKFLTLRKNAVVLTRFIWFMESEISFDVLNQLEFCNPLSTQPHSGSQGVNKRNTCWLYSLTRLYRISKVRKTQVQIKLGNKSVAWLLVKQQKYHSYVYFARHYTLVLLYYQETDDPIPTNQIVRCPNDRVNPSNSNIYFYGIIRKMLYYIK
jgi:hypothetical protein